jgi:hypothetical protein
MLDQLSQLKLMELASRCLTATTVEQLETMKVSRRRKQSPNT